LAAGAEALRECGEISDAVLELTDQRARVLGDVVKRQLRGGGGHVTPGDRECPLPVGGVIPDAGLEIEPGELSERQRPDRGYGDRTVGRGAPAGEPTARSRPRAFPRARQSCVRPPIHRQPRLSRTRPCLRPRLAPHRG
jgi:hypothetical protein